MSPKPWIALGAVGCLSTTALVPPTVDDDPSLPAVEVGGTLLRAETRGEDSDPLLVLLHGGPGADYDGLLRLAAAADDGWQVLVYDQRGGGRSRRHDPGSVSFAVLVRRSTSPETVAALAVALAARCCA